MATMSSSSNQSSATQKADTKISNDLNVLREKMDLLESMLHPPDSSAPKLSVKTDEAVRSVVGYLDACGPRMIELVTACTSTQFGVLSEGVFEQVLSCNDRLQKLLSDFDTRMLTETTASTTVAAAAGAAASTEAASTDLTDQFGDLLLGNEDPFAQAHGSSTNAALAVPPAGAKTTGETSEDFPPPAAAAAAPAAERDPFDDFFAERTGS